VHLESTALEGLLDWVNFVIHTHRVQQGSCSRLHTSVCHYVTVSLSLLTAISRWTWVSRYQNVSILDCIGGKGDDGGGDNWSYKTCQAPVTLSPSTNQHPAFYWLNALPVAWPTALSTERKYLSVSLLKNSSKLGSQNVMTFLHRGVVVALDPGQRSRLHAWVVLSVSSCVRFSEITCVLQRHCSVHRSHGKSLPRENIKCFSADQTDWTWAGIFTCTASALPLVDEQWTLRHTHIICNRDELPIVYTPVIYPLTEIITSAVCCICYTFFHSRLTGSILLHIIHFIPTLLCCRLFDCGVK